MPAERELELDAALDAGVTELLEPLDLAAREVVVGEIGERGAPPQRERLTQRQERVGVLETAGVLEELFEAQGVEIAVVDPNEVAAGHGLDRCRAELFAQLRDEPLERLRSGLGRPPAPQLLDQAVARHQPGSRGGAGARAASAGARRRGSAGSFRREPAADRESRIALSPSPATVSPCARRGKGPVLTAAWAPRDRFLGARLDRPDMEPRRAARGEGGRRCVATRRIQIGVAALVVGMTLAAAAQAGGNAAALRALQIRSQAIERQVQPRRAERGAGSRRRAQPV